MATRIRLPVPRDPRGMAIVMVLIVSTLLTISAVAMLQVNRDDLTRLQLQMTRVQATYLAKGALNLALLKARAFPEALYSGVSYRIGRNPYYPHLRGYEHLTQTDGPTNCSLEDFTNPDTFGRSGPAFITGTGSPRTGEDTIPGASGADQTAVNGDYDGDGTAEPRILEYLARFQSDICDANVVGAFGLGPNQLVPQPNIRISATTDDAIFGIPDPDVFQAGSFHVTDIATYGTAGAQNATSEVLRILVRATLTARYSGRPYNQEVTEFTFHRINRSL